MRGNRGHQDAARVCRAAARRIDADALQWVGPSPDDNPRLGLDLNGSRRTCGVNQLDAATRERLDLPGGQFWDPSITVFEATAQGNAKPLRKIQGPATQLSWPTGIDVDLLNNEIIVANNIDNSVLFFHRRDSGNVKPFKVIKGTRTGINRPMGVAVDQKNNELWVANFGDHTALVFDLKANGNMKPKRIIRNAPKGTPTTGFGNPMALAYDSRREEIVVGN